MATVVSTATGAPAASAVFKTVRRILPSPPRHWVGDGFHVFPVFHDLAFTEELSPWLMFDYAAPKEFSPTSKRRGVGQHPHRGFETITLAFQGAVEHGDSVGNRGVIGPGDVQWMTAARGIIHEEFHSTDFAKTGGVFEMAQLWLNLPASQKMSPPRYQPILAKDVPVVPLFRVPDADACANGAAGPATTAAAAAATGNNRPASVCAASSTAAPLAAPLAGAGAGAGDGFVRLIAGGLRGVAGAAATSSPVELWDVTLNSYGAMYDLELPPGHTAVVFVRRGTVRVQDQTVGAQGVALLHASGTVLRVTCAEAGTQLLVLGGEPLGEPIAARGPFVMNTNQELAEANSDYRSGKLGR